MSRAIGGKGDSYPARSAVRLRDGRTPRFERLFTQMPILRFEPLSVAPEPVQGIPEIESVPWSRLL